MSLPGFSVFLQKGIQTAIITEILYGTDCIPDIEADFQAMLPKCRQVTPETVLKEKWTVKLAGVLLKVAAPLL